MFGYFGAKHALARYYPPPEHQTIVEPYAGAAGYSCYWADQVEQVILLDTFPELVALWHRLQRMTVDELWAIPDPVKGERTVEPLIAACSAEQGIAVLRGKSRQVTDRMVAAWPRQRKRTEQLLPHIRRWDIRCADAQTAPDIHATWFIDPPYQPDLLPGWETGGKRYGRDLQIADYSELARWARSRRGQVIVCEQEPAAWLPFQPFRRQRNGVGAGTGATRMEQMWHRTCLACKLAG